MIQCGLIIACPAYWSVQFQGWSLPLTWLSTDIDISDYYRSIVAKVSWRHYMCLRISKGRSKSAKKKEEKITPKSTTFKSRLWVEPWFSQSLHFFWLTQSYEYIVIYHLVRYVEQSLYHAGWVFGSQYMKMALSAVSCARLRGLLSRSKGVPPANLTEIFIRSNWRKGKLLVSDANVRRDSWMERISFTWCMNMS